MTLDVSCVRRDIGTLNQSSALESRVEFTRDHHRTGMHPAYFETCFRIDLSGEIGPLGGAVEWPRQFVIVTAYATTGEVWDAKRNVEADQRLRESLEKQSVWMRRITGYSPTTGHAEPGWAVALDWQTGCALGQAFAQDAIYCVVDDTLYVTHCDQRRDLVSVGAFRLRLRYPS